MHTHFIILKIVISSSYISIICGSVGMMVFVTKFPFSTSIQDLRYVRERVFGLNGYQVWRFSWLLIILGTIIQLINYWMT